MYGGFGLNTFEDADDGEIDQLFFKSDQVLTTGFMTKMEIVQTARRRTSLGARSI